MTTADRGARGERGSVLLLGIGLLGVCLLAVAVVIDAGAAFQQRQALLAVADGASLAGAQALDLDAYYAQGATQGTALHPPSLQAAVHAYMRAHGGQARLESVSTDGRIAAVEVSAPVRLPFLQGVIGTRIHVRSAARLDYADQ